MTGMRDAVHQAAGLMAVAPLLINAGAGRRSR